MSYFYKKTPELGAGLAWSAMNHLFMQIKSHRGLTTFIEHHGVNGRWLKPDKPFNIRVTMFFKIMEIKAHYQTDEEFLDDWNTLGKHILNFVRISSHLVKFLSCLAISCLYLP